MPHRSSLRCIALLAILGALVLACALPTYSAAAPETSAKPLHAFADEQQSTSPVGPGTDMTTLSYNDDAGSVRASIISVDLNDARVTPKLMYPGAIAARAPVSQMAAQSGAIAAINGDFFDIRYTNAPYGVAISDGNMLKGPIFGWTHTAGVGVDRVGRIADVDVWGDAITPAGKIPLVALNQHNIPPNGIGLYTPLWGGAGRGRAVERVRHVREVTVAGGVVTSVSDGVGAGVPSDGFVLLGREAGADALAAINIGDPVSVNYGPLTGEPVPFQMAIGGSAVLVRDGQVQNFNARDRAPRSAVGFSEDGRRMFLVEVDGRQRSSRGQTLRELAELMQRVGAFNALNLDGGGSSTLLARKPGDTSATLMNQPSAGEERYVGNGIGIYADPGSGIVEGVRVLPAAGDDADRVFPGLSLQMVARTYDETFAPAQADSLEWQSLTSNGSFEGDLFRANAQGDAYVQAQAHGAHGVKASDGRVIHVLPALARLAPTVAGISLNPNGGQQFLRVRGVSADGQSANIEPRDLQLSFDQSVINVALADGGQLQVTPNAPAGSTTLAISAAGVTTNIPVFVGLQSVVVDEFENAGRWRLAAAGGASGALSEVPGMSGKALQIAYNFVPSDSPHRASAQANSPLNLPGQVLRIGAWARGSGRGEQISFSVRGADGAVRDIDGPSIGGDWQYVEVDVPPDVVFPLQLVSLNVVEPDPSDQYSGQVAFDGLGVKTSR